MTSQTITALGNAIINLINRKTPVATTNTVGMVKPDGNTINIDANGVISSNGGSSSLEICDIGMSLYVDESKGLRRYLNGQIVDINTNTQLFLNRLKEITTLHPSLLCTEEEWQAENTLSKFGQVGKFVFNYGADGITVESVRIPRVVNVQGLFDLQNLGMTVGAGLPNIEGTTQGFSSISGAFDQTTQNGSVGGGTNAKVFINRFNASAYNPIYGNSNTVQPEAIQYPYFIQIATGSETENNIINEIELNNPFSLFDSKYSDHELNNLSWLKSNGQWNVKAVYTDAYDKLLKVYNSTETIEGLSVKLSTEDYTDYDFVLNTADETFRLPLLNGSEFTTDFTNGSSRAVATIYKENCNGYLVAKGDYYTTGNDFSVLVSEDNFATYKNLSYFTASSASTATCIVPITKDISYKIQNNTYPSSITANFYPFNKGNGSLYYYVGETVQNANLIDVGRIGEQLMDKANKKEIYNKLANCLLEVPQKIKLELKDGVLTLKAGSKVIVPNGFEANGVTPKFDYVTVDKDIPITLNVAETRLPIINVIGVLASADVSRCSSGNTRPTGSGRRIFYNVTTNLVEKTEDGGSTWTSGYSLPFCVYTGSTTGIKSLDQVFNGMGYIGSTFWFDKGVKVLIPDGRNTDGSLKNNEYELDRVRRNTFSSASIGYAPIGLATWGAFYWGDTTYIGGERPSNPTNYTRWYNEEENYWYEYVNGWYKIHTCPTGYAIVESGVIKEFNKKLPFRAVDYSDKSEISGWGMPSNRYIDLTLGANGSTYTAPANGWFSCNISLAQTNASGIIWIKMISSSKVGDMKFITNTTYGEYNGTIPVKKGDTILIQYQASSVSVDSWETGLKFIYAEGSK